jgi:hypothetical protein
MPGQSHSTTTPNELPRATGERKWTISTNLPSLSQAEVVDIFGPGTSFTSSFRATTTTLRRYLAGWGHPQPCTRRTAHRLSTSTSARTVSRLRVSPLGSTVR